MPDNLARGAKQPGFQRQGRMLAALLDGGRLKGKRERFVMVKNRNPKNVQLQQRKGAGDRRPRIPSSSKSPQRHIN